MSKRRRHEKLKHENLADALAARRRTYLASLEGATRVGKYGIIAVVGAAIGATLQKAFGKK